jgi:hypothetical protein
MPPTQAPRNPELIVPTEDGSNVHVAMRRSWLRKLLPISFVLDGAAGKIRHVSGMGSVALGLVDHTQAIATRTLRL